LIATGYTSRQSQDSRAIGFGRTSVFGTKPDVSREMDEEHVATFVDE
jgi:hypothetical protein